MPALHELQDGFAAAIFDKGENAFACHVRGRFSGDRLLQIYRNNSFASLTAALEAVYPVVTRLVGEGFFRYTSNEYIHAHPSRSGNLHDFGAHFADFLETFAPASTLPYLPDVARLEWAWHCVFHAAEHAPLTLAELAAVSPDDHARLVFALHPATRLLRSDYPLMHIWHANQPGAEEERIDLDEGGNRVLVFRRGLDIEFKLLGEGEFHLLSAFAKGQRFGDACAAALGADPGTELAAVLQQHVALGTLTGFSLAPLHVSQ
jgi:hypothetical protein